MSEENKSKPDAARTGQNDAEVPQRPMQSEEHHALSPQAQRDEEIAAIQQHARHQPPAIEKPPDVPPAPPAKALTVVGVALLVLLIAGALTLWDHATHERALANETERGKAR
jgi:hypothetical protein